MEIRKALVNEIDTLLRFEKGIVEAERPFDSTLRSGEIHYYDLIELIESDNSEVFVATINDEIVGSGYVKIIEAKPFKTYDKYAHLGFMYVKPEFRGKGVNQKIIEALVDWSKNKNITEVRLDVYDENTAAKNAYLKVGFKPILLQMRLDMDRI